jgi:hypothetical protein
MTAPSLERWAAVVSWLTVQAAGVPYGRHSDGGDPRTADAFT